MAVTRRGLYFSLDALLALGLVALGLAFLASTGPPPSTDIELRSTQLRQADAVSESSMQVAMRQPLRRSLSQAEQDHYIDTTRLLRQDLNKSVMEAVAVLWASNDTAAARNLTRSFFSTIVPDRYGYQVVLADDSRQVIYNTSAPGNSTYLVTSSRIISGISRNRPTRGFIARASLSETTKQATENVFYGGYVGDGNLTSNVTLPDLHTVLNVTMEGDIAGPFDLYFNDKYAGHFIPQAANLSADLFHVCTREENASVCDALDPGGNRVSVNFTTANRSIGGGVLRITYNRTTGLREEGAQFLQKRKRIHGIDGTMNLFSSFYVPGELHTARGHLHYTTPENRTLFLRIGNATVYERETSGEVTVTLDNDTIHSNITATGMDYDRMSQRTVPFRLGLQDVAFVEKEAIADSVSVIDVSGSMDGGKLSEAKDAAKAFSRIILDAAGNRAGMVAYEDSIDTTHPLTRNESSLNDTIDGLTDGGSTCIGCGILEAIDVLETPAYTRIIEPGSSWRYNTTYPDSEPPSIGGDTWTEVGYNDSSWGTGDAVLGRSQDAATTLPANGGDYFFRRTFSYDNGSVGNLTAYVRSDDAATVYLNGVLLDNDTGDHAGRYWNRVIGGMNSLFTDTFPSFDADNWTVTGGSLGDEITVDTMCGGTSGSNALILRWGGGEVTSQEVDLSGLATGQVEYSLKQGGDNNGCENPESGDDTVVEYLAANGSWMELRTHDGGGSDPSEGSWKSYTHDIPAADLHSGFKLRFAEPTGSGSDYDYWAVDDVSIGEYVPFNHSPLRDGTNVLAARLKDNGSERSQVRTDTESDWNTGTFNRTTTDGEGNLTLARNASSTKGEADRSASTDGGSWITVNLQNSYTNPIAFATSNTENGGQSPKIGKVRNVGASSFEAKMCEHEDSDGGCDGHLDENLGYAVFERDAIDAMDGVEAGTVTLSGDGTNDATTVSFDETFSSTPVVIAAQQTYNEAGESVVQVGNVGTSSAELYLCDHAEGSENNCESHGSETVAWLAVEPGETPFIDAEAGITQNIHDSSWTAESFSTAFDTAPAVIATIQTNNGGQQAKPSMARSVTTSGMDIRYCEHDDGDTCDSHNAEDVGWLAFEPRNDIGAGFYEFGNYTSRIIDAGRAVNWTDAVVAANDSTATGYSIDFSDNTTWYDTVDAVPDSRYLRFNLSLETSDTARTPRIDTVNLSYSAVTAEFDLALNATEDRRRSMIVMSDGDANVETSMTGVPDHDGDGDVDAKDHTIEAGCRANEDHNTTVYAVGFGSGADNQTLNLTAECGGGSYYFSSTGELKAIFSNISEQILEASFAGQTLEVAGSGVGTLHPDSYLAFNYTPADRADPGTFDLTQQGPRFGGGRESPKNGSFTVPAGTDVLDALVTSYSSNFWTDRVRIQNATGYYEYAYRLWRYDTDYRDLGDPYQVHIPEDEVLTGMNNVSVDTGLNRTDRTGGSPDNRVIYTVAVDGSVGYGPAFGRAAGGNHTFETVGGNVTISVGNATDSWNASGDALDNATARLIGQLDLDGDGVVDVTVDSDDLDITTQNVGGIQWLWGPATVSLEVWERE